MLEPACNAAPLKRVRDENAAQLANSPGSPTPRSSKKERPPTRRRSLAKAAIAPLAEPTAVAEPEPVSNLFNNPFLMQDRKLKKAEQADEARKASSTYEMLFS